MLRVAKGTLNLHPLQCFNCHVSIYHCTLKCVGTPRLAPQLDHYWDEMFVEKLLRQRQGQDTKTEFTVSSKKKLIAIVFNNLDMKESAS